MSEKLSSNLPERPQLSHEAAEISRKNIERIRALAEQEKAPEGSLEALQATIKQEALSSQEIQTKEPKPRAKTYYEHKALKEQAFDRTMNQIRSQLSPVERQFSKLLHQPTVERISNTSAKTIARPSGILGGGLAAFMGSSFILYYAKHLGFTYNYGTFLVLFAGGFLAGIVIELLFSVFRKSAD